MKGRARLLTAGAVLTGMTWMVLLPAGAATQFTNPTPIVLVGPGVTGPPPPTAGEPYPSNIAVSGLAGTVTDVNVILNGFDCSSREPDFAYPEDVDMLLVGPTGTNALVLSDVGGDNGSTPPRQFTNLTITLDDEAAAPLPADSVLLAGTFRPTDDDDDGGEEVPGNADPFNSPAPAPSANTALSAFDATAPNGTWSLYVTDDWPGPNNCTLNRGWTIEIATTADTTTTTGGPTTTTGGSTTPQPSSTTTTTVANQPPNAVNDSYTTPVNTPLVVPAPGVLANDTTSTATR